MLREDLSQLLNTLSEEVALNERKSSSMRRLPRRRHRRNLPGQRSEDPAIVCIAIGSPLSVNTDAAHHYEVTLVQLSFDFYMLEAKLQHLGDSRMTVGLMTT